MTKKPPSKTVSADIAEMQKEAASSAEESWQSHWNVARRLLELRRRLRGTTLWKTFELQRSFEAFSIHTMAPEIEQVAGDCGLISSFKVTRWEKNGNRTVVEGMVTFENVDDGEVREYPGIGEAVDNGDKGLHKADSDARKVAMINALNLGIGSDKEASNEKPDPAAGPQMSGAPKQSTTQKATTATANNGATSIPVSGNGAALKGGMFTFAKLKAPACSVLAEQLVGMALVSLQNECGTVTDLDDFGAKNDEEFQRFSQLNPDQGKELRTVYDMRRKALTMAGRL